MSDKEVTLAQLKKAFQEGYNAFFTHDAERKMIAANPYPLKSILGKEWERGFNRCFTEVKDGVKQ